MFLAKKLNRGAGTPVPVDAQFNYVTMLLHGDGTNGAQNNTFVDSSTNTFTITRAGNTTQGSFSPYGSNWSNYFNGSSSYLSSTVTSLSGQFTIEFMYYSTTSGTNYGLTFGDSNTSTGLEIYQSGGNIVVYSNNGFAITGTTGSDNSWIHIALTRDGSNNVKLFVNGIQQGSTWVSSATFSSTLRIGVEFYSSAITGYLSGYISNLRILNVTSTPTVPTSPLTAISGTTFLTCQSNRFLDNSSNAYAITATGSPSVERFNPFGTSTAYSTSVIGGSAYFNASTSTYLTAPSSSNFTFTGDFTVECWLYVPSISQTIQRIFSSNAGPTGACFFSVGNNAGTNAGAGRLCAMGQLASPYNVGLISSTSAISTNTWVHAALVRSGSTVTIYQDGVSVATGTNSSTWDFNNGAGVRISGTPWDANEYLNGYVSNLRVTNTAVYTSAFTPNTAPLTAISGTSLLLSTINGAIFDNAMMTTLETVGDAQISTSVKKYGTGSLSFDGTGDWVRSFDNLPIAFGSGDFTVEGWIYLNNVSATKGIMYGLGNNSFGLRVGQGYLGNVNGLNISRSGILDLEYCAFTFSTSTWYHIAVVRSGTTIYFFVNGTQQTTLGSGGGSYNFAIPTSGFIFGANNDTNERFNGYIDDFRITKGYARYTANFTAPTAEFLDIGPN